MIDWIVEHPEFCIAAIGAAWGALWTWFKGTEWYADLKKRGIDNAKSAIETIAQTTVDKTYQEKIKAMEKNGKFTDEQVNEIRDYAWTIFLREASKFAPQALKMGKSYIQAVIEEKCKEAKAAGKAAQSPAK